MVFKRKRKKKLKKEEKICGINTQWEIEMEIKMDKIFTSIKDELKTDLPQFRAGDTVSVGVKVIEGGKTRVQLFDGVVISISSGDYPSKTFTVRKISNGVGVERIFPYHSPNVDSVKLLKKGMVRRAKLYYLRSRKGKAAKIKTLEK